MAKPLRLETTKKGIEVCSGKPKVIIISNWFEEDKETGFITQGSIDGVLKIITKKLLDMKFSNAKPEEQNVIIHGQTIMIFQSVRSSGKLLKEHEAPTTARAIMEQFFKYATDNGYFDEVDPTKLAESVDMEVPEETIN